MADTPPPPSTSDRLGLLAAVVVHNKGPFLDRVESALRLATEQLGFDVGLLSHVTGDVYTVFVAHAPGTEIVPGATFPLGDTYCSLVLEHDDLIEIDHMATSEHRGHPCYDAFGLESYLGVPIHVDGVAWGTLNFSSATPRPSPLHQGDRDLVRLLALWIGGVLEREMQGHRLAVEAGRLNDVVDQAPIIVYGLDAEGRVTLSEGAGLRILGQKPGDVVGKNMLELYPDDTVLHEAVRRVLDGEPQAWEARLGDVILMNQARPVRGPNGDVTGLIGVSLDVSAQVRSREALTESESRFRALSAATFEGIAFSEGGVIFDANDQLARLFGYKSPEDVIGRSASALVTSEDLDLVSRMIRENRTEAYEARCVRLDGSTFWAEVQGHPVFYEGRAVRVTAIRDITARKLAEEQRRFQADVLAHVSDAVIALDLDGRVTYWNAGAERLHGTRAEDALGRPLQDLVHYLLPNAADGPAAALTSTAARDGDLVFEAPDGQRRYVQVSSSVLYDEAGEERGLLAVSRDVTSRRLMASRLRHQATHDALTGLPNRTLFHERIEAALAEGGPFGVLFVDLDRFKVVNDSLGHGAGDVLLMEIGRRLEVSASGTEALVARLGGDEFAVLVPGGEAEALAERILEALDRPVDLGPRAVTPSASVGVVPDAARYGTTEALLRDADTAMYAAKREGRARLVLFSDHMHEEAALRFGMEHDLRYAAGRGQIVMRYQPLVELEAGTVVGFEALIRWDHPELGLLPPDRFLPLAEELGLVTDLDRWALDQTCAEVATWGREALDALATVSVNCSDQTFLKPGLVAHARAAVDLAGLPPDRLVLELTERALVDLVEARDVVHDARRAGLRVSIDDFGAGYSSLGLLHALPVDGVKIDRTFVSGLETSAPGRAVVRAVVGLADELGMRAVAEGVETPGQLRALRAAGTHVAQGFLFARPVPAPEARAMLTHAPWADAWESWVHGAVEIPSP